MKIKLLTILFGLAVAEEQVQYIKNKQQAYCQVYLALGAITALSDQPFRNVESTFASCPDLIR
jgi:hypothetical protein